jgi:hypothetical protein
MVENLKIIGSRIYYTDSARELGFARFVLGGVILFFGLFFIWIELYIVGIPVSVFAVLMVEHCTETLIDKENLVMFKKAGWIKPFLTLKMQSIAGVESLSIETVSTRRRAVGRVGTQTTISYKLYFNISGRKLHILTVTSKTNANKIATEIARLLEIEFLKSIQKTKKSEDN